MARMLPPRVPPDLPSRAEVRLFEAIRSGLGEEWTALHSLGLAGHDRKPWAEADFVLIGPAGVFCLEVKGGRVRREEGLWIFTDRDGREHSRHEGPFAQAAGAAAALREHLVSQLEWMDEVPIGYGVAFPDVRWDIKGPDMPREIVYDERDRERPFREYVGRLADHWRQWKAARSGRAARPLSPADCAAAVRALRGDFDLRPSLRAQIGQAQDELLRLTEEQYRVLDGLAENRRLILYGGAGTGKTWLAVEEARRRAEDGQRVFFICYNKRLGQYLRQVLAAVSGQVSVWHLHGFTHAAIHRAGLTDQLSSPDHPDHWLVHHPQLCLDALLKLDEVETADVLIVDEAQDLLRPSYLEVFDAVLKGGLDRGEWRFFLDPNQNIFGGLENSALARLKAAHPAEFRLTINCRNTAQIVEAATRLSGINCGPARVSGPEVEFVKWRDAAEARREVSRRLSRLLSNGVRPEQVVILSPHRREHSCLAEGLVGVTCELVEPEGPPGAGRGVHYYTVQGFKGLEADIVLLIDLEEPEDDNDRLLNYVGASRAKALLVAFVREEAMA